MNEGHAAFLTLERMRRMVEEGAFFAEALERVRSSTVFTTHTPVAAGHDAFEPELAERYLRSYAAGLGVSWSDLAELGRDESDEALFGMTPLALRTSAYANAVSLMHGRVSRRMWRSLWPGRDEDEVPITHITNGVHPGTWLSPEIEPLVQDGWGAARSADPETLWRAHQGRKEMLLRHVASATGVELDPQALTLGFARRFATYKRADLLLAEADRFAALLTDHERPVQILFAGKAHPADDAGKDVLRRILAFTREPRSGGRAVFLEGYDLAFARLLVQGCDVWLNTPIRPLEASGTSGMKAGMNGVLNVSILDGWWYEGYSPEVGWAIGDADAPDDDREDRLLLDLLERGVVPRFYDERAVWIEMMKASIAEIGARFNSHRMVMEYVERLYLPAHRGAQCFAEAAV
jgi:starch phosphorylase